MKNNSFSSYNDKYNSKKINNYKENSFLYSWGKNKYGELGLDNLWDTNIPSPITSIDFKLIYSIKAGGRNTVILSTNGFVYLCGSNIFGLLASNLENQNNEKIQKTFKKVNFFIDNNIDIKDISIAEFHCLALDKNGRIFGWGGNLFNKLGKKFDIIEGIPHQINIKKKIISISCGDYHSCALTQEGLLYSWGGGGKFYNKGQCGHGTTQDVEEPKIINFFKEKKIKIKQVCCGGYHTIVIADSNELFSFGGGIYGQCGYGHQENISTPKKVHFKEKQNLKYEKSKGIIITDIKCGGEHSLFLSSNNNLYSCGHGYYGQLGLGNNKNIYSPLIVKCLTNKKVIKIAAGWNHSLVLTSEGNIYSTGCNKYGELGTGKEYNRYKYTWVDYLSKINIKDISAGGHHSWCLIDPNKPLRDDINEPEPLLDSNFSMTKSINKRSISEDIHKRRRSDSSFEEGNNSFNENNYSKNNIKYLLDHYNNDKNDLDELIENINRIDKENYDKKLGNCYCELKIVYTDLNLSHRFIRFKSSIDYNKLIYLIKNKFVNKDKGNISFQFQRDDEIGKNSMISPEIHFILNKLKNQNLINFNELKYSYTLGIAYDYSKSDTQTNSINNKLDNNNNNDEGNILPLFGFKDINSNEILSSEKEKYLSSWVIDFTKLFNELVLKKIEKIFTESPTFLELRPNIFE